jgi:hypothetical protein
MQAWEMGARERRRQAAKPIPLISSESCDSRTLPLGPAVTASRFEGPDQSLPGLADSTGRRVGHEYDLAGQASFAEQLVRVSRMVEREPLGDERLDLLLVEEVEQSNQVQPEPRGLEPLEPLDAVGNDPLATREEPASGDVPREVSDLAEAMTSTNTPAAPGASRASREASPTVRLPALGYRPLGREGTGVSKGLKTLRNRLTCPRVISSAVPFSG